MADKTRNRNSRQYWVILNCILYLNHDLYAIPVQQTLIAAKNRIEKIELTRFLENLQNRFSFPLTKFRSLLGAEMMTKFKNSADNYQVLQVSL